MTIRALQQRGHTVVYEASDADEILIATCVVIDSTERKMLNRLKELSALGVPIAVTGCAGPTSPELVRNASRYAAIFMPGDTAGPVDFLAGATGPAFPSETFLVAQKRRAEAAMRRHPKKPRIASVSRIPFTEPGDVVYPIPIASGCKGTCAYCITRKARGSLKSKLSEEICEEARFAIEHGAAEIQLCAQDSGVYGTDIGGSLPELVKTISSLEGDFMVRVGMMNPGSVKEVFSGLLESYSHPRVYKFLHLPVQSGDDGILESMGRGHTAGEALEMMKVFKERFPESTISTDVIVGFPGEDSTAHSATVAFLEESRPDIVNVTRFSPRPGTDAAVMDGTPHGRVVKARSRELTLLRKSIAEENNAAWLGRWLEVLATEGGKGGTTMARTSGYKQTIVAGRKRLGKRYNVRIVGTNSINLFGKIE